MLNDMAVRNAKPKDRDYKLADSEGLYLFVSKSGHKSWRLKYRFAGKERRLVFGPYPEVTLAQARDRKADARKLLREGRDPGLEAKKQALRNAAAAANTFEAMARTWFGLQEKRWTAVHAVNRRANGTPYRRAKGTPFHDGARLIGHAPLRCARRREGGARPEARAAQSIF